MSYSFKKPNIASNLMMEPLSPVIKQKINSSVNSRFKTIATPKKVRNFNESSITPFSSRIPIASSFIDSREGVYASKSAYKLKFDSISKEQRHDKLMDDTMKLAQKQISIMNQIKDKHQKLESTINLKQENIFNMKREAPSPVKLYNGHKHKQSEMFTSKFSQESFHKESEIESLNGVK